MADPFIILSSTNVSVNFENVRFEDAIEYLRSISNLNILVDWPELELIGAGRDTGIELRLEGVSLQTALERTLSQMDGIERLVYDVTVEYVLVSTEDGLRSDTIVLPYDVTEIMEVAMREADQELTRGQAVQQIIDFIEETVDSPGWISLGGETSSIHVVGGKLMISTTGRNHRSISSTLHLLRMETSGDLPTATGGPVSVEYNNTVFINCPFDDEHEELFLAMMFAVKDCGFRVRCAREQTDGSQVRISKIYEMMSQCRLGIHDLSRLQLDETTGMPRFNMPFELGLFLGAKYFGNQRQGSKACLIFDAEQHRYQVYLSDIAGQDIRSHNGDPQALSAQVRD